VNTIKVVKYIVIGAMLVSACPAAQSIVLQNGTQASGRFPSSPAFTSIGAIRMEFRLHGFTQPADYYGWIFYFGQFSARFYGSSLILNLTDNADANALTNIDLNGRTDVLVRFQRDQVNNRLTMEVWNASDGAGYSYVEAPLSVFNTQNVAGTAMAFGAPSTSTDLAYLRMYSTVLPLNSPPPSRTNGNLGDWEFEGNLTDKSGQGINLSGSVSYVPTPSYPIKPAFGQYGTERVWNPNQGPITLDGSATFSSVDDPNYTYSWSQIGGPGLGSFSAPTGVITNFFAFLPGDYQIGLAASDGITTSSLAVDVGAVNADQTGIVHTGNPEMDIALGPLSMWGTSPWPWYDLTEMADADSLYTLVTTPPTYGQTVLSGTITAVNGSATVTGVGTNFFRDLTDCDPSSGSGSAYTCISNVPYAGGLSDINLRDRYFIPDRNCSGSPTLNVNSTIALPIYGGGTNTPASCTAGSIYQYSLEGCPTAGGALCSAGPQWTASAAHAVGDTTLDAAYHVQMVTVAGISGGTTPPWNDSAGTTIDGTVTWQDEGLAFYTIAPGYPLVWFWWNAPDGPGTGRIWMNVGTINSPTSFTIYGGGAYVGPTAQSSGIQYSNPSEAELGIYWNYVGQPSNNLNYYDVVHALYKLYYRTNLTKYLTEARAFADNWYMYATGQGYYYGAPRAMAYLGMIDRAIDGHPTIWTALEQYFTFPTSILTLFQTATPQSVGYTFDTRETGYAVRYLARVAALDPDPGWHTTGCTYLHNVVANIYHPVQDSFGQWEVDDYSENPSYAGAKLNGRFGSSPWRDAMSGLALEESYDILTNNCGDSPTAALALSTVIKEADFTHDYGEGTLTGGGVGQFGNVMYGSMIETNIHASFIEAAGQYVYPLTTGTLAVTNASANVVGTGTNFTAIFSAIYGHATPQVGVDPAFIGIPGLSSSSCSQVPPVASVADDTHLTLSSAWPCASASGVGGIAGGWIGTPSASTNCALFGSVATTCEGPVDPSLSHEVHAMWSWLYWRTGNSKYMTWAEQSAGTDYGGSGGGPGSPLPPAGPYATGSTGNFLSSLPPCGGPPCGGYGPLIGLGKDFGFSAGAGDANNAMAYLILGNSGTPLINRRFTGQARITGHTQ
jgi:hypothetical protein